MLPIYKVLLTRLSDYERKNSNMCTSKKMSMPETSVVTPSYQTPTLADASVTKTSDNIRRQTQGLGGRNIRTTARGIEEEPITNKRKLLGE